MTVEDKFGNTVDAGDTVEFVYGGDAWTAEAEAFVEMAGRDYLQATITVFIPAGSAALVEKAKPAPRKSSTPKAEVAADAAQDQLATKAATDTEPADTVLEKPPEPSSTKGKK